MSDITGREFQEAGAAVRRAVTRLRGRHRSAAGEVGGRPSRLRRRDRAGITVRRVIRTDRQGEDRRWTGDAEAPRRDGGVPGREGEGPLRRYRRLTTLPTTGVPVQKSTQAFIRRVRFSRKSPRR